VLDKKKFFQIKEGPDLLLINAANPEKELTYLLTKDFEESWNVSC